MSILRDYLLFGGTAGHGLLLSGQQNSGVQAPGAALAASATLIAGSARGDAHASGAVLLAGASVSGGGAVGSSPGTAPGTLLEVGAQIVPGRARSYLPGQGILPGGGSGLRRPNQRAQIVPGALLGPTIMLVAGGARGGARAVSNLQSTRKVAFDAGTAAGAAVARGGLITAPWLHYYSGHWTPEQRAALRAADEALLLAL